MPDQKFQKLGEELFKDLSAEDAEKLSTRLHRMIDYAIKRQDWYEDQRTKVLTLALGLLALSSFLVSGLLSVPEGKMLAFRICAALTLSAIALTSFSIIYEYARSANEDYTHRGLADIRSWFFAYVAKSRIIEAAVLNFGKDDVNRTILREGWLHYLQEWKDYNSRPSGFLVEDLQQVYILFLFQGMRRRSLRKMVGRAYRGGMIVALLLIPTIIFAAAK